MPIKPKPFVYVCQSCGWKKAVTPRSDALMPGEYYVRCPKCDATNLKREELSGVAKLGVSLFGKFYS